MTGAEIYNRLMQRYTDVHSVDGLIASHARLVPQADEVRRVHGNISPFEDLSFTHHEGEDALHHLRDVKLDIRPGRKSR